MLIRGGAGMPLRILELEMQVRHRIQIAARRDGERLTRPPGILTTQISVLPLLFEMNATRVPSGDQRG